MAAPIGMSVATTRAVLRRGRDPVAGRRSQPDYVRITIGVEGPYAHLTMHVQLRSSHTVGTRTVQLLETSIEFLEQLRLIRIPGLLVTAFAPVLEIVARVPQFLRSLVLDDVE